MDVMTLRSITLHLMPNYTKHVCTGFYNFEHCQQLAMLPHSTITEEYPAVLLALVGTLQHKQCVQSRVLRQCSIHKLYQ
eukprot:15059-Heterococcus_DN1.PRE.3